MKLNYNSDTSDTGLGRVLQNGEHRIELHIKRRDDDSYTLICFSGRKGPIPDKTKSQGPYHSKQQAAAASNAIVNILIKEHYQRIETPAIWSIQAQSEINAALKESAAAKGNYEFDPNDVYFDLDIKNDDHE